MDPVNPTFNTEQLERIRDQYRLQPVSDDLLIRGQSLLLETIRDCLKYRAVLTEISVDRIQLTMGGEASSFPSVPALKACELLATEPDMTYTEDNEGDDE